MGIRAALQVSADSVQIFIQLLLLLSVPGEGM
jgi:hypothetical protein